MSEQVKSNKEVLSSTPVENNVDAVPFDAVTEKGNTETPSSNPAPVKDSADISEKNEIVDVSALPDLGIDFNDFESAAKGLPKEVKKEEPKKEDVIVTAPKTVTKTDGTTAPARDYSDFPPEEQEVLKKMSNQAFSYVAPKLKQLRNIGTEIAKKDTEIAQLKSGKQMLPDNYFEHPQAFVLTPEFNTAAKDLNDATTIQNHWRHQLVAIRKGEPWHNIIMDNKGNLRIDPTKQVSNAETEMEVTEALQFAVNQTSSFQQKMGVIQNSFMERHTKAVESIKTAEKEQFKVYEDANHPMQPVIKSIIAAIPAEFRNNPLTSLVAKAGAAAVQFGNLYRTALAENAELKKQLAGGGIKESKQGEAGPTKASVAANGGGGKQENTLGTNIADFEVV